MRVGEPSHTENPETGSAASGSAMASRDTLTELTTVSECLKPAATRACLVWSGAEIVEIANTAAHYPAVGTIAVVDQQGKLEGVISRQVLLDELFLYIRPEAFLREVLRKRNIDELGRLTQGQNARNLMARPVSVRLSDTLGVAFQRMHDAGLSGLPIVDDEDRVVGYLDQLQLMAIWLRFHQNALNHSSRE